MSSTVPFSSSAAAAAAAGATAQHHRDTRQVAIPIASMRKEQDELKEAKANLTRALEDFERDRTTAAAAAAAATRKQRNDKNKK